MKTKIFSITLLTIIFYWKRKHVNRLTILFLSGIAFSSCNSPDNSSGIDLTKNHSVSVFDVFSDVHVIGLETTESSLITDIAKIEYFDSQYFILDVRSQQIFCFDEDGRFVFKIDSQGKGPGEYHYMQDFSIDQKNEQLVILDPVVQRVHFFDLNGRFLISHNIKSEIVLGLNRVYPLQDSLLLLISITYERLQIYCLKEEKLIYADFTYDVPSTLHAFSPRDNVFFFDDKVLFLVPLSLKIVNVSAYYPETYFSWDFGPHNNSEQQINRLLEEIRIKQQIPEYFLVPYQAVGKNKILNHHIIKSFENKRFRIAVIEFDNDFKFVIIDKSENHTLVFSSFAEGILLPFDLMQSDRAIAYFKPEFGPREIDIIEREGLQDYFYGRNFSLYSPEILHDDFKQIIESHDPMTDNPFLVVYKFKE